MSLEKYCCGTLGTKPVICGSEKRKGGIKHAFVLRLGQTTITDFTDSTEWQAAILNGDVTLIQEISGEYPEVSEQMSESEIGCQPEELDGFDHVFNWRDRAVTQDTSDFYQEMNECTFNFGFYDCQPNGTARVHVVEDVDVRFVCKPQLIERDSNTTQVYVCRAMWKNRLFPVMYNAPDGIFD